MKVTFIAHTLKRSLQARRLFIGMLAMASLWPNLAFSSATARCEGILLSEQITEQSSRPESQQLIGKSQFETLTKNIGSLTVKSHRLSELLAQSAGVSEGYSIQEHINRVYEVYSREREPTLTTLSAQLGKSTQELDKFLSTIIVLHDIGKPLAVSAGDVHRQHEFTLPILSEALQKLGWNAKDIELAETLVGNDAIGQFMKGSQDAYSSLSQLSALAHQVQLPLKAFLDLQMLFYKSDAGSYPFLKDLLFVESENKHLQFKPGRMDLLAELAGRKDLEQVLRSAKSPDKIEKLRKRWMNRQEKLFENLFTRLDFGDFAKFEQRLLKHVQNLKEFFPKSTLTERYLHPLSRLEDLHEGKVEVRIRTSTQHLTSILTEGYKNKSEGGAGSLQNGTSGDIQDLVEASFLGASPKDVAALPAQLRPRYGFLAPSKDAKCVKGNFVSGFLFKDRAPDQESTTSRVFELGDVTIILDPKEYEGALTLTAGDSANSLQETEKAFDHTAVKYHQPEGWEQVYIPWKYRMALHRHLVGQNYYWDPRGGNFEFAVDREPGLLAEEMALGKMRRKFAVEGLGPNAEYFEVQIWKPIRKILAIEIRDNQVLSDELKALLEKMGVEVRISPLRSHR